MHTKDHQTMLKLASQAYMARRSMDSTPTPSDMHNLDNVLATIAKDNPRIFLTDETLHLRKFYHKPKSASCVYAGYLELDLPSDEG